MPANDGLFLVFVAPPTIASEPPQTNPSPGTVTIGNFACTGSTLSCPIEVSTGTPVNITWRINGDQVEFISTASAQTVMLIVDVDTPGTYTCNATNHFGTAEVSSEVVGNAMCVHVCVYAYMYVCMYVCMCVCMYMHVCLYMCMYVCMYRSLRNFRR